MKKLAAIAIACLTIQNLLPMEHLSKALRYVKKRVNPDAIVTQQEEIDRSIGIFKDFIESLRTKQLRDLKRDPQFLERIYQINSRSHQIGESIKGCIQNQRYIESSKAREILINHPLATSPFIAWLTYKALYEDGRITKQIFEQYLKIEEERFYFMLRTLIPKDDQKKFTKASQLLDEKEKIITVNIVDTTKDKTVEQKSEVISEKPIDLQNEHEIEEDDDEKKVHPPQPQNPPQNKRKRRKK